MLFRCCCAHAQVGIAMKEVAIVGAGVIGLSTAKHLVDRYGDGIGITVLADKFSPDTTSDKSGAIIIPLMLKLQSQSSNEKGRLERWTLDTFELLRSLYHSGTGVDIGLSVISGFYFGDSSTPIPWWKDVVFGFRCIPVDSPEVKAFLNPPEPHDEWSAFAFATYLLDCRSYLPWLMRQLVEKGVVIENKKLKSLNELSGYDIVINCSGLGAAELVGDTDIGPVRGQAVLVRAPWIKHTVLGYRGGDAEDMTYIFPRSHDVLLGGTAIKGDWSEEVDPATTDAILTRCTNLMPSLRGAEVIGAWAGGRPVRSSVRLELDKEKQGNPLVVHNYGHGSQGVVLHWGCALEVGKLLEPFITGTLHSHL